MAVGPPVLVDFDSHSPRSQPDRTRREDRRLKFYELRDNLSPARATRQRSWIKYRDPESQASIESWFGKLKERCIWREEFDALDRAREAITSYLTHYHHRPHSGLDYRTPLEVAAPWNDGRLTHPIPAA
jgi:putative transposase